MIYLIGGSPRSGKSILSRKLSKKLNIPYMSTDNLRPIILPYFPKKEQSVNFPFEKMFNSNKIDNYFIKYSGKEILKADLTEAKNCWAGEKNLIGHLLLCKMDYVIEGVHLLPSLIKEFKKNKNIKVVYLTKKNKQKIFEGLIKNKKNNDWMSSHTKKKEILWKAAESIAVYNDYFEREVKKYNFAIFNSDDHFEKVIKKAISYLVK
jgi:2-phosphoglycerate kinase